MEASQAVANTPLLVQAIMAYLPAEDWKSHSLVSRRWLACSRANALWKGRVGRRFPGASMIADSWWQTYRASHHLLHNGFTRISRNREPLSAEATIGESHQIWDGAMLRQTVVEVSITGDSFEDLVPVARVAFVVGDEERWVRRGFLVDWSLDAVHGHKITILDGAWIKEYGSIPIFGQAATGTSGCCAIA